MKTPPACTFDNENGKHEYRIGGSVVSSVTQIVGDVLPGFKADPWYLERGRAVHECYAFLARSEKFECDKVCEPYVEAWHKWRDAVQPRFISIERRVYSVKYRFAGTMDLLARINDTAVIVDYKSSLDARIIWQLAGYAIALEEEGGIKVDHGYGVQLSEDEKFKSTPLLELKRAKREFLSMLTVHNLRTRLGINTKKEQE